MGKVSIWNMINIFPVPFRSCFATDFIGKGSRHQDVCQASITRDRLKKLVNIPWLQEFHFHPFPPSKWPYIGDEFPNFKDIDRHIPSFPWCSFIFHIQQMQHTPDFLHLFASQIPKFFPWPYHSRPWLANPLTRNTSARRVSGASSSPLASLVPGPGRKVVFASLSGNHGENVIEVCNVNRTLAKVLEMILDNSVPRRTYDKNLVIGIILQQLCSSIFWVPNETQWDPMTILTLRHPLCHPLHFSMAIAGDPEWSLSASSSQTLPLCSKFGCFWAAPKKIGKGNPTKVVANYFFSIFVFGVLIRYNIVLY